MRSVKFFVICVLLPSLEICLNAATIDTSSIEWTYTISGGKVILGGGNASHPAIPTSTTGDLTIPESIDGREVVEIGQYAFAGCSGLTSVTIPDSVTRIGYSAFYGCSGLEEITLPFVGVERGIVGNSSDSFGFIFGSSSYSGGTETVQYYAESDGYSHGDTWTCYIPSNLKRVIVTDETVLASYAFYGCSGLTSVTIPDSVTRIGHSAFSGCNSALFDTTTIPGVRLVNGWVVGYESGLSGAVDLSGARGIGDFAFSSCSGLTSVTIPDSVTLIGNSAFYNCSGLTSVTIPDSVTSIERSVFSGCSGLTSVTIPDSVTSIELYAFYNCSGLTSVTIPDSVTRIGSHAFSGCNSALFDTTTIPGVRLVNGWVVGYESGLSGAVDLSGARGIGDSAFSSCSGLTSVTIPDSVTSIERSAFSGCRGLTSVMIPDSVTSIGDYAFSDCIGLTSVAIPDSVTSIGDGAFVNCSGLTSVTIPDSVTNIGKNAFRYCSGLASVTIPQSGADSFASIFGEEYNSLSLIISDSVTSIGDSAFEYCSGLTSVTIPDSVTNIGKDAFRYCSGLASVTIPQYVCTNSLSSIFPSAYQSITNIVILDSVTSIGDYAFSECIGLTSVTIPDSVTSIGDNAFYNCSLTSVTIPDSVTSIGDRAFFSSWLKSVKIGNGVTSIGDGAFSNCSLTSVTIPDSVTSIGDGAFSNCSLTSVTIPNSVASIGNYTFQDCSRLMSIAIPDSVMSIGSYAFCGCSRLTSVSIPDSVTSIGNSAFSSCTGLTSVTISDSVTSIGYEAFCNCASLTSVIIPNSVTNIEKDAFYDCSGLTSVTIPQYVCTKSLSSIFPAAYQSITNVVILDSVTNIGSHAFYKCRGLTSVAIPDSVTSIDYEAFNDCSGLTSVAISNPATRIEQWAFRNCSGLTSVTLFCAVTNIGYNAFYGCNNVVSLTADYVPNGIDKSKIEAVVIPCGAESISDNAFSGCIGLTSVTIGNDVTSIGSCAFRNCSRLTSLTISDSVTNIANQAFAGCSGLTSVTIPDSVTNIGKYAFEGCSSLYGVIIPDSVASIGEGAFSGCSMLTTMDIPHTVKSIGAGAFDECWRLKCIGFASLDDYLGLHSFDAFSPNGSNSLYVTIGGMAVTNIVLPVGTAEIAAYEFSGFRELESVTIPQSVTNLSKMAFAGCKTIKSVTLPTVGVVKPILEPGDWSLTDENIYQSNAIQNSSSTSMRTMMQGGHIEFRWKVSSERNYDYLRFYVDGVCVASISGTDESWRTVSMDLEPGEHELRWTYSKDGSGRYGNDCGWVEVSPSSLTVGDGLLRNVFADSLAGIETVTLKEGATEILDGAFNGCAALIEVRIPSTVTNVGVDAFIGCEAISKVCVGGDNWTNFVASIPCGQIVELRVDYPTEKLPGGFFDGCTNLERIVLPVETTSLEFAPQVFYDGCVSLGVLCNGVRIATSDNKGRLSWSIPASQRIGSRLQLVGYDATGRRLLREVSIEYDQISARPDVMISPESGTVFETSQKVVISSSWPEAVIHYTTDGSEPTAASPVFKKFNVTGKTTVKAIAIVDGYPSSEVVSATYGVGKVCSPVLTCSDTSWTFAEGAVDVAMSCSTKDVQIRYTLDGSMPTSASMLYSGPISIDRTTTIRAIAGSHSTQIDSDVVTRTVLQRLPVVSNPVISCATAEEVSGEWRTWQSGNVVIIDCATAEAEIHYTTNGMRPDVTSPIYTGPIYTDETLQVQAIAYAGENYLSSDAVSKTLVRRWHTVSTPVISAGGLEPLEYYVNQVSITCDTEGATIYYTVDGSDPSENGMIYLRPFRIDEQTTIRAMSRKYDSIDSDIASLIVEKTWFDGMTSGYSGVFMSTNAVPWLVDSMVGHSGGESFRSGAIGDGTPGSPAATVLTMACEGAGYVKFWWKASCEDDPDFDDWDHAVFTVNGVEKARIDGETAWNQVQVELEGDQMHLLAWSYYKDDSGSDFDDCVWVDDVELVTGETEFAVSFEDDAISGAGLPASFQTRVGSTFVLPSVSVTRKGYVFAGWSYSGTSFNPGDNFTMPPSDVTFSTVWRPIGYYIAYNPNGGVGCMASTHVEYDTEATIASNVFTRSLYKFAGWATDANGLVVYSDGQIVSNLTAIDSSIITLYAVWEAMSFAEILDCDKLSAVSTTGDALWTSVGGGQSCVGESCLVSGSPTEGDEIGRSSILEAMVRGAGTLTFWWKVSSEPDRRGTFTYDFVSFEADGVVVARIDGIKDWIQVSHTFSEEEDHVVRWIYNTDGWSAEGYSDCAWVDGVAWKPAGSADVVVEAGGGKTVTVPGAWLSSKTARAATDAAANGRKVWECYVLGLDPEDASSDFKITAFPMKADGTPDLENVSFAPAQSKWNVEGAKPVIKGRAMLEGSDEWQTVTDGNKADMRFFRVEVELP